MLLSLTLDFCCFQTAREAKVVHRPYGLPSSGLGVLSSSLARLMYSQGMPRESTLSSRPAWGRSVGLCSDVKLVSRQSRCGGVPASRWHLVGLDGDSKARISCSCSCTSSSWTSIVWWSRAASDDASVEDACPDANRCGLAGPRVVTTWHDERAATRFIFRVSDNCSHTRSVTVDWLESGRKVL